MAGRLTRPSVGRWARGLLVSVALAAVISGVIALLEPQVPALRARVLYLLAVLPVAIVFGTALAAATPRWRRSRWTPRMAAAAGHP